MVSKFEATETGTVSTSEAFGEVVRGVNNGAGLPGASTAVANAIRLRTDAVAQVPLVALGTTGNPATGTTAVARMIAGLDTYDILRFTECDMSVFGNAYWRFTGAGTLLRVERLDPTKMVVKGGTYTYDRVEVAAEDIIHFRETLGNNDYGMSPLKPLVNSANLGISSIASNWQSAVAYQDKSRYILGIEAPKDDDGNPILSNEDQEYMQDWLNNTGGEADKKPGLVARAKMAVTVLGGREDKQFVENQVWVIQEVARALDVPPVMLADLSAGIYNNVNVLIRAWWSGSIASRLRLYENTINQALLERNVNGTVVFDRTEVEMLQPDQDAQSTRLLAELRAGAIDVDEFREMRGYEERTDAQRAAAQQAVDAAQQAIEE